MGPPDLGARSRAAVERWIARRVAAWGELYALTPSELRVAHQAIRGLSNKEIARALRKGLPTVRTQLFNAARKIGVDSRGGLAFRFFLEAVAWERSLRRRRRRGRTRIPRVLVLCRNRFVRSYALEALDDAGDLDTVVVDPRTGRGLLELDWPIDVVVIEQGARAATRELVKLVAARPRPPRVVLLARRRAKVASDRTLPMPFEKRELALAVEWALRAPSEATGR